MVLVFQGFLINVGFKGVVFEDRRRGEGHTHEDDQSLTPRDHLAEGRPASQIAHHRLFLAGHKTVFLDPTRPEGRPDRLHRHAIRIRQHQRHHLILIALPLKPGLDLRQPIP